MKNEDYLVIFNGERKKLLETILYEMTKFRIVKYDLTDLCWYPIQKHKILSIIASGWKGLTGAERGAPGNFNYQLEKACNPTACLFQTFENIIANYEGTNHKMYGVRESLPKCPIVKEVDMEKTKEQIVAYLPHINEKDFLFDQFSNLIIYKEKELV